MIAAALVLVTAISSCKSQDSKPKSLKDMGSVDQLLAPIALYPDQLIAQILMSAQDPPKITELAKWLKANESLKGGFALAAWPAQYGATGVMTFIVNQDGVVFEKDLGKDTNAAAEKMIAFNPDRSWRRVP